MACLQNKLSVADPGFVGGGANPRACWERGARTYCGHNLSFQEREKGKKNVQKMQTKNRVTDLCTL